MCAPGASAEDLELLCVETGFSRFPVRGADDTVVGYLHIKDALQVRQGEREEPLAGWRVRDIAEVDEDEEVESVLARMRRSGAHVALVRRDATVAGVVFLEDIIEELVGEVRDIVARFEGELIKVLGLVTKVTEWLHCINTARPRVGWKAGAGRIFGGRE